jgi:hypothetical protein
MTTGKLRLVFIGVVCVVFLGVAFGPSPLLRSYAQGGEQPVLDLAPDPDGESTPTITLTNTSGDPPGTVSAGYMLDDGSVVVNMAGIASGTQAITYEVNVDEFSNSYSISTVSTQQIPPCIAGSVRLSTIRKSDETEQVRTVDRLIWRIFNGQVGVTSYLDDYQTINGGGLTWTILRSPVDPPYTTSPFNANAINDTGNGKYKNFNFGDPNLSTVASHFIRLEKRASDGDFLFRYEWSHKMKNEGVKKFRPKVEINRDLPNQPSCTP